jgi:hypothetical protein
MSGKEVLENKPVDKSVKKVKDLKTDDPEIMSALKQSRFLRLTINTIYRFLLYSSIFITQDGRNMLSNPEARRMLYNREARTGLLLDSIIADELYVPNEEGASLELKSAVAGRFVSYDFHRPEEFKSDAKKRDIQNDNGRLIIFALDEVKDNDKNHYTPTELLDMFNVLHVLSVDTYSLEDAIDEGYLIKTTYKDAYKKVGLYNKYGILLGLQGLDDKTVYVVTPKGNGIVALAKDGGEKRKQPKTIGELKPVLSFPSI